MADARTLAVDVKVGAFVLIALVILILGSLWIAGSRVLGAPRAGYHVLMQDSGGLQAGDRVRIAGVSVGRITRVLLDPDGDWPVALTVAVKRDVPIHTDGTATVGTTGLLGAGHLEIDPGSPAAGRLAEGGRIHGTAGAGLADAIARVDDISGKAMQILDQLSILIDTVSNDLDPVLGSLERMLSPENTHNLAEILANLRSTTDDMGPQIADLLRQLETTTDRLDEGLDGFPRLTTKLEALTDQVHSALGPDGERLSNVLESAESSFGKADETLSVLGDNRTEIETTLRDLRDTTANLKALSQSLKERPYTLVRVKPLPDRKPGDGVSEESR